MSQTMILFPVLTLVAWTFIMWMWMYATRIPAMREANIDFIELSRTGAPLILPAEVARVGDNYNHLHEQPTLFYAVALSATALSTVDEIQIALAWGYVSIRIVHSLVQASRNVILIRFWLFALASALLLVLLARTFYAAVVG